MPVKDTVEAFKKISEGEYDHFPEQAFFMCGGLDDLERNAQRADEGRLTLRVDHEVRGPSPVGRAPNLMIALGVARFSGR